MYRMLYVVLNKGKILKNKYYRVIVKNYIVHQVVSGTAHRPV
jgi:hypothetical protein